MVLGPGYQDRLDMSEVGGLISGLEALYNQAQTAYERYVYLTTMQAIMRKEADVLTPLIALYENPAEQEIKDKGKAAKKGK